MTQATGQYVNFAAGSVAAVNAAETVIGTTPAVSSSYAGSVFVVEFAFDFLTGAGTTNLTTRIRRQSLTGTAVLTGPAVVAAAASQVAGRYVACVDVTAGEVASFTWVLTILQTAGAANGAATNVFSRVTAV